MSRWVPGAVIVAVCLCTVKASGQVAFGAGQTAGVTFHRPAPAPAPPRAEPVTRPHVDRTGTFQPHGGDLFRAHADTYAPYDPKRPSRVKGHRSFSGYFPTPYLSTPYIHTGYIPPAPVFVPQAPLVEAEPHGYLRLEIRPATAQVFVDGLYAGTAEDFSAARSTLEPGPHRLEIRAPGYESVTVDIVIRTRQTTTYMRDLGRLEEPGTIPTARPAPVAAVARATPKAIYVVPRCYAGDRRPVAGDLPDGCDIGDLRVIAAAR